MQHLIVLTRPEAKNQDLAFSLQQAVLDERLDSVQVLSLPALRIEPYSWFSLSRDAQRDFQQLNQFDAIFCVSPNAITIFFALLAEQKIALPSHLRFLAVGEGSREALLAAGIDEASIICATGGNDSESLMKAWQQQSPPSQRVLIVRGETGRNWLSEQLQAQGVDVRIHAIYRRIANDLNPTQEAYFRNITAETHIQWLLTSSESVRALLPALHEMGIFAVYQSQEKDQTCALKEAGPLITHRFWVLHSRIGETIKEVMATLCAKESDVIPLDIALINIENTQIPSIILKHIHNMG